jgi:hypothetical protein
MDNGFVPDYGRDGVMISYLLIVSASLGSSSFLHSFTPLSSPLTSSPSFLHLSTLACLNAKLAGSKPVRVRQLKIEPISLVFHFPAYH